MRYSLENKQIKLFWQSFCNFIIAKMYEYLSIMKKMKLLVLMLLMVLKLTAQTDYPKDYFQNPVDIPIVLAGTFGELRSNHFHAGIDIKTQKKRV